MPFVFTLASIGLLVMGNFRHINAVGLGLAGAALVVVLARVALTFKEVRSLPETKRQAVTDELTGLSNRRLFYNQLRSAIEKAERGGGSLAVLMIDLDRFKELNDTLGHHAGDILLKQLGPRLQEVVRDHEALARLGGDEFAVLLPGNQAADSVAERIGAALERPFMINGVMVQVEASTGIALYPDHARDADGLLQRADVAMYQAKEEHIGFRFYSPESDQHSPERLMLIGELRQAIHTGQLTLYYQPKVETDGGAVTGVEALVRWRHPTRGLVQPNDFIPMAEQTGVMRPFTLHVLEIATAQCRAWLDAGYDLKMSVNISAANLLDEQFPHDVERLIEKYAVPARYLQLEITENSLMRDIIRATEALEAINGLGAEVSLDDFGTGFSSLSYLKDLAVDELKIDKSFVINMAKDTGDAAIVRSVVDLGRSLGIRVVAEGVEKGESLDELADLGCDLVQGYYLSRPLPAEELERWLAEHKVSHALAAQPGKASAS
jgi:diguanylate cyclase (GGDEF)-like protein